MSAAVAAGAALGGASSLYSMYQTAQAADEAREAEMNAAKASYAATESSMNLVKAAAREAASNNIQEAQRAGAAKTRETRGQIQVAESKSVASSEGMTSGRSKGREMIALHIKGNEAINDVKDETTSIIGQAIEQKDKIQNDANNQLYSSYLSMVSVLSTPSAAYENSTFDIFMNTGSGALSGASSASSFS